MLKAQLTLLSVTGSPVLENSLKWLQQTACDVGQAAATLAAGAAIMKASGHDGYEVSSAAKGGALGATVVLSLANGLRLAGPKVARKCLQAFNDTSGLAGTANDMMWTVPAALLGVAMGHANNIVNMSAGPMAIAASVGTAVCIGGMYALTGAAKELGVATQQEAQVRAQTLKNLEQRAVPRERTFCSSSFIRCLVRTTGYTADKVLVATERDLQLLRASLTAPTTAPTPPAVAEMV